MEVRKDSQLSSIQLIKHVTSDLNRYWQAWEGGERTSLQHGRMEHCRPGCSYLPDLSSYGFPTCSLGPKISS